MSEQALENLISVWDKLEEKGFSRQPQVVANGIFCDCSGFISLLCDELGVRKPYGLAQPKAVHFFAILQEIGSSHISQIKPWHLLAWRKDQLPKSGDTGHILLAAGEPKKIADNVYRLKVVDSTKAANGLARREICLHTSEQGRLLGVQLHMATAKVKRTPIYHAPLLNERYCLACGVPQKLCLCEVVDIADLSAPSIIILRHPEERKKTLSTVSLIKQRYPSLLVKEGEHFAPLRQPNLVLLFPDSEASGSETDKIPEGESLPGKTKSGRHHEPATMVLLDATWRKAKRILHENPWLGTLPRISLEPTSLSDYRLRKVPNEHALSTVEVFAMVQKDSELQELFRVFMQKQIELMGRDKYEQNYRDHINYEPK